MKTENILIHKTQTFILYFFNTLQKNYNEKNTHKKNVSKSGNKHAICLLYVQCHKKR